MLAEVRIFFGKLAAEGTVTEPLPLTRVNDGMLIVRGEMETLLGIIDGDDFITLVDKAMYVAEDFEFFTYYCGESADHRLELYARAGSELAYL